MFKLFQHMKVILGMSVFFPWFVGFVARDKQIAKRFSGDMFIPRYDSFPMNQEKKTLIPYIYNASNEDPL